MGEEKAAGRLFSYFDEGLQILVSFVLLLLIARAMNRIRKPGWLRRTP
jgi:hypothetical protein